jgi:hypothetical protein
VGGGVVLGLVLASLGVAALRGRIRDPGAVTVIGDEPPALKEQWTMPPLALLSRPRFSAPARAAMLTLGGYMVVALIMLIVKSIQLAGG